MLLECRSKHVLYHHVHRVCLLVHQEIFHLVAFEIPTHWWPETESCIKMKDLTTECRSDIVRTLVTLMITKVGPKPTKCQCEKVARKLILKYPFMKDDIGFGYVSA